MQDLKVGRWLTCGFGVPVQNRVAHEAEEQRRRGRDQGPWGLRAVVSTAVDLYSRAIEISFWLTAQITWETTRVLYTLR